MTINRRTFVAGTALVAVAPALELVPLHIPGYPPTVKRLVFMIDGWSAQEDGDDADCMWIMVGRSWRTAWR
jgi:hypothetical protein